MLAELEVNATNYEMIYGPLGLDWREQFRKRAEQEKYARELGLQLGAKPKPAEPAEPPAKEEEEEEIPIKKA
jgi:hypothetical protein